MDYDLNIVLDIFIKLYFFRELIHIAVCDDADVAALLPAQKFFITPISPQQAGSQKLWISFSRETP